MLIFSKIKPRFWDSHDEDSGTRDGHPFSFRRKWKFIVTFTTAASLIPLLVMTVMDYRLSKQAFESEAVLVTSRMVSTTWRGVSSFLSERRSMLEFIAQDNTPEALASPGKLESILKHLHSGIGGFIDIGLLDSNGKRLAYAGPILREDLDFKETPCFRQVVKMGYFISDVKTHEEEKRRLILAVRHDLENGGFFILRSGLKREQLYEPVLRLGLETGEDAFIINSEGLLQTPSRYYGTLYDKVPFAVPPYVENTRIMEFLDPNGRPMLSGYAHIPGSDFILMILRPKSGTMDLWLKPRINLIGFLIFSIFLILASILGMATYLVNRIHSADQKRTQALHEVEHANRLASIGRLASGVAHEINNPLAVITQKVGLIKDLFTMRPEYAADEKLIGLLDDALDSIYRCGAVTRRLLDFSSHMESSVEKVNVETVVRQVLGFLEREAEKRCIGLFVDAEKTVPKFDCDRGALQQVVLNLINNAFSAMEEGGRLEISIGLKEAAHVVFTVADSGSGIPEEDIKRIFEPFFTTRHQHGAAGLGLSITYGLVREMGGNISVESRSGEGSRFTVTLPLKSPLEKSDETITTCEYYGNSDENRANNDG